MRYLLDTHTVLFAAITPKELSAKARVILEDSKHHFLLSQASLWEIALLESRDRIKLKGGFSKFAKGLQENLGVEMLPLEISHFEEVIDLPFHHRDPFDRILIAQARVESLPVLGRDEIFEEYDVRRIW